jgi:hypothetical protein
MTIPSVPTYPSPTCDEPFPELHLSTVRTQAAIVWAIADALGREHEGGAGPGLREQLAEELARLGCLAIEAAAALADACDAGAESGVHPLS